MGGWVGGRNHYLAEWGEYEPGSGFTYRRVLLMSVQPRYGYWFDGIQVVGTLRVADDRRSFHVYVETWGAEVRHSGVCTSIPDAKRQATEWLVGSDATMRCLRRFYSRENIVTIKNADDVEVLSMFCRDFMILPRGKWSVAEQGVVGEVERWPSGYTYSPRKASREGARL